MNTIQKGQRVRLKNPEGFVAEVRNKCGNGRVGVVTGLTYPSEQPIVTYPKEGRKKEFRLGAVNPRFLEVVPTRFFQSAYDSNAHYEHIEGRTFLVSMSWVELHRDEVHDCPTAECEERVKSGKWVELEQAPELKRGERP